MSRAPAGLSLAFFLSMLSCAAPSLASEPETYHLETVERKLERGFTAGQIALPERLNRADRDDLTGLRQVVVPNRWLDDERAYSPLPVRYQPAAGDAKLIVIELTHQVFGAYVSSDVAVERPSQHDRSGVVHAVVLQFRERARVVDPSVLDAGTARESLVRAAAA